MGIREAPEYLRVFRWPQAIPQYTVGHAERIWQLRNVLTEIPGIFMTGSIFQGVGISDCIRQGQQTATHALKYLGLSNA
jgi:oxygen-dependent protoporphyrinogen oxidase